jgi:hypothetical protein
MPKFEILEGENYVGVRVQTRQSVEETYLNLRAINGSIHTSSGVQIGDWMTDAYLLHISRPASADEAVERYFVSDGSYLRHGGRSHLESLTKVTACWSQGGTVEVFSCDTPASLQIAAESPPQSVRWNGTPVAAVYDNDKRLVSFKNKF